MVNSFRLIRPLLLLIICVPLFLQPTTSQHQHCMQEIAQGEDAKECFQAEEDLIQQDLLGKEKTSSAIEEMEALALFDAKMSFKNKPRHVDPFFMHQIKAKLLIKGATFDVKGLQENRWIRATVTGVLGDLITIEYDCLYSHLPIWLGNGEILWEITEMFQQGSFQWPDTSYDSVYDELGYRYNDDCTDFRSEFKTGNHFGKYKY